MSFKHGAKIKSFPKYILSVIIAFFIIFILWKLFIYIAPFVLAYVISNLIEPINLMFMRKFKFSRKTSTLLSLVLVLIFLGTVLTLFILKFISEIFNLSSTLPSYIAGLYRNIEAFINKSSELYPGMPSGLTKSLENTVANLSISVNHLLGALIKKILNTAVSIPHMMLFLLVVIISTYFLSCDRIEISNFFKSQLPEKWIVKLRTLRNDMFSALFGYIKAQLILMFITFVLLFTGFLLIGIKQSLTLALLICFIDALPILGTGSILLPWAIYEFILGNFSQGISVITIYIVVFMVRQITEPKLVSQQIGVHPLLTLFAMYLGLQLFGVFGMIIGPIAAIIIKSIFSGVLKNRPLQKFL